MQSAAPCLFTVIDYSAKIDFTGNRANHSIGHHMYGTSVRDYKCDQQNLELAHQLTKSYCWYSIDAIHKHINISFDPGLNETLSPVSSAPQRVCLCDSNGKPQCARLPRIFTTISIYCGETFSLSACIVGYDFGTTVGVVHAGFLNSNHFSQLDKSQYNQPVSNSETCSPFSYTVYSKRDNELLLLQQMSALPVSAYIGNQSTDYDINDYNYTINYQINNYNSNDQFGCIKSFLLTTPIFINITLLSGCPPGLTLNYNLTECGCYLALSKNGFRCSIQNKTGFLQWNNTMWVNATFNKSNSTGVIYNRFCPLYYCKYGNKTILEMTPASSVPSIELVSRVVPAWGTLAWQLDLLSALNVLITIM